MNNRVKHYYSNDNGFSQDNSELPDNYVNSIICGDSLAVLRGFPNSCIDLIFTSPPYNFGMEYQDTDDMFDWSNYFDNLFEVFDECIRVLKYGGRCVVNIQPCFSDYVPTHHIISNYFMDRKMIWKGEVIWDKRNYNCKYTAWGSWCSPSNPYMKYTWEFIEIFAKGDIKKEGITKGSEMSSDEFKEWVVAKWEVSPEHNMKKYGHPAMFPEKLAYRVINLLSFKDDIVLDPFCGAGTTCVTARKSNRRYVGIDISPQYCETAENRLQAVLI